MIKVKATLQQLKTKHESNPVRTGTDVIEGWYFTAPKEKNRFVFYAPPLTVGTRIITTSKVHKVVVAVDKTLIMTENSEYELKVIK